MSRALSARPRALVVLLFVAALSVAYGCAGTRLYRDDSSGSALYYSRCRSCHAPVNPASKSRDFWDQYLGRYADRAQLTESERDSVMAFILRASRTGG